MTFNAERLTELREAKWWTKTELAWHMSEVTGNPVPVSCVSRWEAGKATPRAINIKALARILGVSPKEFIV
jgi:ribosome-binding protein aMBF1 (putative translation factor)